MNMSIFDMIGPVMVGPSSSHTAGVVRIGNVVRMLLGSTPVLAGVEFRGSFASTYQGHGSDRAIVAGMLGLSTEDSRIRDSLELAGKEGLSFSFEAIPDAQRHPNTLAVHAESAAGKKLYVEGFSVGGGNILIVRINDIDVEYSGKSNTIIVRHQDEPGVVAGVTRVLAEHRINIAGMKVYRSLKGGRAIMMIETDEGVPTGIDAVLEAVKGVSRITILPGLF